MQAGIGARVGRAVLAVGAAVAALGGFSSGAWASPTLSAGVTPAKPGNVALTLATTLDSDPSGPPSDQLGSVSYALPGELSDQIAQLPACDPSTFVGPASSVSVSLTDIATGVKAPSSCPAGSVLGSTNAQLFEALTPHAPLTAPSGEIVHTSGAYPLTLWLNYYSPGYMSNLYIALGGTVAEVGGQTVLTFDTDDAQGATSSQGVELAYGIPSLAAPFVAINDLSVAFSSSGGAFAATGCSNGLWAFSEAITYTGYLTTSGGYDTYATPAPPAAAAATTVPCTGSGAAGGGSSGSSGSGGSSGGSGGVSGSTTTTPGKGTTVACVVPRVSRGATLSSVETALKRAHCTVGHISRERSRNVVHKGKVVERAVRKGRVIAIGNRAGTKLKVNSRVSVTVSSGA